LVDNEFAGFTLTNTPELLLNTKQIIIGNIILITMIGLPLSLITSNYYLNHLQKTLPEL
jgi:hypothetical protein